MLLSTHKEKTDELDLIKYVAHDFCEGNKEVLIKKSIDLKVSFYNNVCYFLHAPRPLMKRFKWRAAFLATNLETLGMVPFFCSWPLQDKMLSVGPKDDVRVTWDVKLSYRIFLHKLGAFRIINPPKSGWVWNWSMTTKHNSCRWIIMGLPYTSVKDSKWFFGIARRSFQA